MKLLITGIAGFIGSKIAHKSIELGYQVIGVDDLSNGKLENIPTKVEFINLDLALSDNLCKLPRECDVILHLAGQSSGEISFDNPVADLQKNTQSTLNLIKYGIDVGAQKIVYASSMSVYGTTVDAPISESTRCSPLSCYGAGKMAAEHYLEVYKDKLPYIAFRMFNVYGPGQDMANLRQGMVSIYLAHIIKSNHVQVKGKFDRFRDFIYIDDVVDIWLQSISNHKANNQCYNLGTGVRTTVLQLLESFKTVYPTVTWEENQGTPGDQFGIYADTKKLSDTFNVAKFKSLKDGLELFSQWVDRE